MGDLKIPTKNPCDLVFSVAIILNIYSFSLEMYLEICRRLCYDNLKYL